MPTKPFVPSSSLLLSMIDRAMAKCDGDMEQARMAKEARELARAERFMVAEANGRRWRRLYAI